MAYIQNKQSPICIDGFREFLKQDPITFNQLYLGCCPEYNSPCSDDGTWGIHSQFGFYYSHAEVYDCLCAAFDKVARFTNIYPTLQWTCDETIEIARNWNSNLRPGIRLEDMVFKTQWSMVKDWGARRNEKLGTANVIYVDDEGDGFSETAYVEFDLTGHNVELCDLYLSYTHDNFKICPIKIESFDSVTNIVRFRIDSWHLVKPELYKPHWKESKLIDACKIENLMENVDIYVDGIDTCKPAGVIEFEDLGNCRPSCDTVKVPFCVRPLDECQGLFKITLLAWDENGCAVPGTQCIEPCLRPVRMKVNYRSGCGHDCLGNCGEFCNCTILHTAVYMIASSCLSVRSECCECVQEELRRWQREPFIITAGNERFNLPASIRNDPSNMSFGMTLGDIQAAVTLNQFLENFCDNS